VASKAGDIAAKLQKLGTPIVVNDCLIGGTALAHNLVLVSRNVRHFEKITELLREVW
jgi:tRNA(fMet)-specific endonuclease VapC